MTLWKHEAVSALGRRIHASLFNLERVVLR